MYAVGDPAVQESLVATAEVRFNSENAECHLRTRTSDLVRVPITMIMLKLTGVWRFFDEYGRLRRDAMANHF